MKKTELRVYVVGVAAVMILIALMIIPNNSPKDKNSDDLAGAANQATTQQLQKKCGNGIWEPPEDCDGADIMETCESMGYNGGTIRCENCYLKTDGCYR